LFHIDIKYYRGTTAYTPEQLINYNNLTRYDIKPSQFSAEIYRSFKSLQAHTVKINVDDVGFATIFQEDMKHFLLKKTTQEKERKDKAKSKRHKRPEPEPTDWIVGNIGQNPPAAAKATTTSMEDYVIEDDEELAAQELANVDVNGWLTLMSQDFVSPTIPAPIADSEANKSTFINTVRTSHQGLR
jgi:hypothetical protein